MIEDRKRLAADAAWNYVALGATMVVGASVMFLISWRLGTPALGVFAQLYAVHAIAAQLAVFGIHDSTQKHVAEVPRGHGADRAVVGAALALVLLPAGLVGGALFLLAGPIGRFVGSGEVETGLRFVVDNTNPTRAERQVYIRAAREAGFRVVGYYFRSRVEECRRRNEGRPEEQRVPAVLEQNREEGRKALAVLDAHLAATPFLIADRFSVADIVVAHCVVWAIEAGWLDGFPHLLVYLDRLRAMPNCPYR